jgi:hypothetical protein
MSSHGARNSLAASEFAAKKKASLARANAMREERKQSETSSSRINDYYSDRDSGSGMYGDGAIVSSREGSRGGGSRGIQELVARGDISHQRGNTSAKSFGLDRQGRIDHRVASEDALRENSRMAASKEIEQAAR